MDTALNSGTRLPTEIGPRGTRRSLEKRRSVNLYRVPPLACARKARDVTSCYFLRFRHVANVGGRRHSLRVVRARSRAPDSIEAVEGCGFSPSAVSACGVTVGSLASANRASKSAGTSSGSSRTGSRYSSPPVHRAYCRAVTETSECPSWRET